MTWTGRMYMSLIAERDVLIKQGWQAHRGKCPALDAEGTERLIRLEQATFYLGFRGVVPKPPRPVRMPRGYTRWGNLDPNVPIEEVEGFNIRRPGDPWAQANVYEAGRKLEVELIGLAIQRGYERGAGKVTIHRRPIWALFTLSRHEEFVGIDPASSYPPRPVFCGDTCPNGPVIVAMN